MIQPETQILKCFSIVYLKSIFCGFFVIQHYLYAHGKIFFLNYVTIIFMEKNVEKMNKTYYFFMSYVF